jgi:hypothetical protein
MIGIVELTWRQRVKGVQQVRRTLSWADYIDFCSLYCSLFAVSLSAE